MLRLIRLVLFAVLTAGAPAVLAQGPPGDLTGVFVVGAGPAGFGASALNMVNPEPGAPLIALTPSFIRSAPFVADTLNGRPRLPAGGRSGHSSFMPSMSASGRVVYVADWFRDESGSNRWSILAQDRDGTDRVVLTRDFWNGQSVSAQNLHPDISPDGETVVYAVAGGPGGSIGGGELYRVPSDGSAPPEMFDFPARLCGPSPSRAVFSPDGSQIAFLGTTDDPRGIDEYPCASALFIMDADGSNLREYVTTEWPMVLWDKDHIGLDWKGGRILLHPANRSADGHDEWFMLKIFDVATETFVHEETGGEGYGSTYQLSPDGRYIGYVRGAPAEIGHPEIVVRPADRKNETYAFGDAFPNGQRIIFDWADLPRLPEPDRLVFEHEDPGVLLWDGRAVDLRPTLYGTDGSVLSRTVHTYRFPTTPGAVINHFTNELWGGNRNVLEQEVCAENGGIETCHRYSVVEDPIIDLVVLDDEIAEEGRDPAASAFTATAGPTWTSSRSTWPAAPAPRRPFTTSTSR